MHRRNHSGSKDRRQNLLLAGLVGAVTTAGFMLLVAAARSDSVPTLALAIFR